MSSSPARIFIGTVLLFLLVGGGFAAGYAFFQHKNKNPALSGGTSAHSSNTSNPTLYYYSAPSTGVLLHTAPIEVPKGTLLPLITMTNEDAAAYEKGQQIIFYDKDGKLLDMVGEITDIIPAAPPDDRTKSNLVILIRAVKADLVHQFTEARIALSKESNVARLPLSAITTNKKGEEFVWELANEMGGYADAMRKPADIKERQNEFVVIIPQYETSNNFILNPDKGLRDGQRVRVEKKRYEGPRLAENELVLKKFNAVVKERQGIATTQRKVQRDLVRNQSNGGQGCPAAASEADKFIQNVRNLAKTDAAMDMLINTNNSSPLPISRPAQTP